MEASMKPYCLAIIVQLIYTGFFVISKAAFNQGINTYIFFFYRQAIGSILLLPIALLQRYINKPPAAVASYVERKGTSLSLSSPLSIYAYATSYCIICMPCTFLSAEKYMSVRSIIFVGNIH
jgi:drug/metabolite transporter (DMT)-like permease